MPAASLGAALDAEVGVGVGPLAKREAAWGFEGAKRRAFQANNTAKRRSCHVQQLRRQI